MAKQSASLDDCFQALSHPTRRAILDRLTRGPATVGDVSEAFDVAAPTISRHLDVLEKAGLVARERIGRDHFLALRAAPLRDANSWLSRYSRFWHERLDALEELVAKLDDADMAKTREKRR